MGMGCHKISNPDSEVKSSRPCKCGKGKVYTIFITDEESEYPPFERGHEEISTSCPNNCEKIN